MTSYTKFCQIIFVDLITEQLFLCDNITMIINILLLYFYSSDIDLIKHMYKYVAMVGSSYLQLDLHRFHT